MMHVPDLAWHEWREKFAAIRMSAREIAGRLDCGLVHVEGVFCGRVPLSNSFAERLHRLIRAYERNDLPEWQDVEKQHEDTTPKFYSGLGVYHADYVPAPATQATQVFAGSSEKMQVLRERAERGQELFHPQDLQISIHPTLRS